MLTNLSRYWWLLALRGAAAIIFGILAFVLPQLTVGILVILFGAYVIVDGISSLISGFSHRETNNRWWVTVLEGVVSIAAGIFAFFYPGITAFVLLYVIAAWAILTGVLEIVAAIRLREEMEGEWILGLTGAASLLFGILLFVFPGSGVLAVIWLIAAYSILFGILMVYLSLKLREVNSLDLKHA